MQQLCCGFIQLTPTSWLEVEMELNTRPELRVSHVKHTHNTPFFPVLHLLFYISYLGLSFWSTLARVETSFATWDLIFCLFLTSVRESLMFSLPSRSFIFGWIVLPWEQESWNRTALMQRQSGRSQSCSSFNHVGFPLSNSWWLSSYRKWVGSSGSDYYNILPHVFSFVPNFSSKATAWVAFPMLNLVKKIDFYFSFSSLWQILKPVLIVQFPIVVCIFTISGTN